MHFRFIPRRQYCLPVVAHSEPRTVQTSFLVVLAVFAAAAHPPPHRSRPSQATDHPAHTPAFRRAPTRRESEGRTDGQDERRSRVGCGWWWVLQLLRLSTHHSFLPSQVAIFPVFTRRKIGCTRAMDIGFFPHAASQFEDWSRKKTLVSSSV